MCRQKTKFEVSDIKRDCCRTMLRLAAGASLVVAGTGLAAGILRKRRTAKRKREPDSSNDGGAIESESHPDAASGRVLLSRKSREPQNDGSILSPWNGGPLIDMTIKVLWRDEQSAPRKKRRGSKTWSSDSEWWTARVLDWRPPRWWRSAYGYHLVFEARDDEEPTESWMGGDLTKSTWMFHARCQVVGCGKARHIECRVRSTVPTRSPVHTFPGSGRTPGGLSGRSPVARAIF